MPGLPYSSPPPVRSSPPAPSFLFSTLFRPSASLKFTPLNSTHLNSLFDPPPGPFWSLLTPPNRPKIGPSRLLKPLEALFFQKHEFSRNIGRRSVWRASRAPRRHPRRPKIDPRRLQDDLQELLFSSSFLSSILVRFVFDFGILWLPFGLHLGPLLEHKSARAPHPVGSKTT